MFGRTRRITVDKELLERVTRCAERAGYSSVEEFVTHAIEKQVAHFESAASEDEIKKRLKGLGYLS